MKNIPPTLLFVFWIMSFGMLLFGVSHAFGFDWWLQMDELLPVRLWIVATPFLVFFGRLFKDVTFKTIAAVFVPWLGWLVYFMFNDGKSLMNLCFLDSWAVAIVCLGILLIRGKARTWNRVGLVFALELIGIILTVRGMPIVGE